MFKSVDSHTYKHFIRPTSTPLMNDLLASQRLHTMKSGYNSNTSPRTDITPRSHRISKELNNQSSPEHLNTSEVLIEEIKEPQANLTQKFE